jgi:hypothetical protein
MTASWSLAQYTEAPWIGNGPDNNRVNCWKLSQETISSQAPERGKVQRPERKLVAPSGAKRPAPRKRVKIWSDLHGDMQQLRKKRVEG